MRCSKGEAEAEAVRLAREFVAGRGGSGWTCLGAMPSVLSPGFRRRKDVIKWSVSFDPSADGVVVDGPVSVRVDLDTGTAEFF